MSTVDKAGTVALLLNLLLGTIALAATPSFPVNANEAVFEVHGIVCSFCSKGVENKLSRLPFIDPSKYKEGVLVEIESQRVTVLIKPGQALDSAAAFKAIRSGGYEPIRVHIGSASGEVRVIEVGGDD